MRPTVSHAGTVALWLFDEPAGVSPSSVPGKFGRALHPILATPPLRSSDADFAVLTRADTHVHRASFANATDSKLNLGPHDWTIECWLKLDRGVGSEGVIFEVGSGPRGENELVTRFSVVPREEAFVLTHLAPAESNATTAIARRVEFSNPGGPPNGDAELHSATLALTNARLSREQWFHVALVHEASGLLRLSINGQPAASVATKLRALPHGDEAYVSIGRDGRGGHPLGGAIDELRLSDAAVYPAAAFSPPRSFARTDDSEHD